MCYRFTFEKSYFNPLIIFFFPGAMSERLSDESSGGGAGGGVKGHGGSDSHPDTLTDPEFSDPPLMTSSPPQSGDEHVKKEKVR